MPSLPLLPPPPFPGGMSTAATYKINSNPLIRHEEGLPQVNNQSFALSTQVQVQSKQTINLHGVSYQEGGKPTGKGGPA